MHTTFKHLVIDSQSQLYDLKRIKRIFIHYYLGFFVVVFFCSILTVLSLVISSWILWTMWNTRYFNSKELWISFGISVLFFVICYVMAKMFLKEIIISDILGYIKHPQQYIISEGQIVKAEYIPGGGSSKGRMIVHGTFNDKGMFIEEFQPSLWSKYFTDKNEEQNLRKGDDWYSEKGKRIPLPVPVFVLHNKSSIQYGTLIGIDKGIFHGKKVR